MLAWLKDVADWIYRVWFWIKGQKRFWQMMAALSVVPLIYALVVASGVFFCPLSKPEVQIRWTGMVLELLGLGTVVCGMVDVQRKFTPKGILGLLREAISSFPRRRPSHHVVSGTGSMTIAAFAAQGYATATVVASLSIDDRIAQIEREIKSLSEADNRLHKEFNEKVSSIDSRISGQTLERNALEDRVRKLLQEVTAGGVFAELIGVIWISVGIVLATASSEF